MRRQVVLGTGILAAIVALAIVLFVARRERTDPARCPAGLWAQGPRCCGEGQSLAGGACSGVPIRCPDGLAPRARGCVAVPRRVRILGGTLTLSPNDWEAEGIARRTITVTEFEIDAFEVTHDRFGSVGAPEPGLPVTSLSAEAAEAFCRAQGGRLPSADEWLFAATGISARRFPWGPTGLVCRRATFGLVEGPCGTGATGPELAGARPDGKSPDGVLDLAGNVAEWAREPNASARAHGGSFRSRVAGELKSWSVEGGESAADHVGFRCAYSPTPH